MMKMKGWFEEKDYILFVDLKFKTKIWLKVFFFFKMCDGGEKLSEEEVFIASARGQNSILLFILAEKT